MDWNIFKFHRIPGNKTIIEAFEFPVKLNRKNFKYLETGMDVDEEDSSIPNAETSTSGAVGSGGLLEGLDLQDLKNVTVPTSASHIGTGTPGTSTPGVKTEPGTGAKKNEKLVPLKGPDGQSVIGPDGSPVMVTPAVAQQAKGGRMPFLPGLISGGDAKGKKGAVGKGGKSGGGKSGDGKGGEGRKRGGKKTRQVFMIPEATRQLKKEERYPWLWEDKDAKEIWEGRRIEKNKVKLQLLQVCKDGTFRWYPARKQYMFTKLPTWRVPNAEEANERVCVCALQNMTCAHLIGSSRRIRNGRTLRTLRRILTTMRDSNEPSVNMLDSFKWKIVNKVALLAKSQLLPVAVI